MSALAVPSVRTVTDHPTPKPTEPTSRHNVLRVDELTWRDPEEPQEERPRWYWPLFAAMLVALAVAMIVWPVVVFRAVFP